MSALTTFLLFAGTILVLVGAHEVGHFIAARLAGVRVLEFAVGFGPRLWSRRRRDTVYSIRLVPVGGFVRMAGDVGAAEDDEVPAEEKLVNQRPLVRVAIGLAGPLSNVLITLVLTLAVALGFGIPAPQVVDVMPGLPADGVLQPGDVLLRVGEISAASTSAVTQAISSSGGAPLDVLVLRDGVRLSLMLTPIYSEDSERYILGFYMGIVSQLRRLVDVEPGSPLYAAGLRAGDDVLDVDGIPIETATALVIALQELLPAQEVTIRFRRDDTQGVGTIDTSGLSVLGVLSGVTFDATDLVYHRFGVLPALHDGWGQFIGYFGLFGQILGGIVTGQIAPGDAFRGPVGIAQMLGESAGRGTLDFLVVFSLLSLSLGLMNLLPFPALDGSRVAFALYELIRGKPVPPKREGLIHAIGFLILMGLFVLITYKDLLLLFR